MRRPDPVAEPALPEEVVMEPLFRLAERWAAVSLRLSLGVVLAWIGALKFVDPTPVVGLLQASFSFLASPHFVYVLGAAEVAAAALLFLGVAQRWVGCLCMGLFSGTLAIFVIAPAVSYGEAGFPNLSLAGQFLLKDLVLFAASVALVGLAPSRAGVAVRPVASAKGVTA
jgi:uncharacterized membrane protein YkgB